MALPPVATGSVVEYAVPGAALAVGESVTKC